MNLRRALFVLLAVVLAALLAVLRAGRWSGADVPVAPDQAAAKPETSAATTTGAPPPAQFGTSRVAPATPATETGRLVVGFADDATRSQRQAAVGRVDGTVDRTIAPLDAKVVDVPDGKLDEAAAALERLPSVDYAEPDVVVRAAGVPEPNDMLWPNQWGWRLVGVPSAWSALGAGAGVVVAVLDSGADFSHPDLKGAFVAGYDVVNGDADPTDDNGHGTAAAGVVAARANNHEGGVGVCFQCSVMPVKVLGASGAGTTATVAAGIVWAVDHGARVVSLSLGAPATTQALADAVAYAQSRGAVLVAAAGNNGVTTPFYPAAYPGVVSVAATTAADALYPWSNRGDWVTVAAPGCNLAPARGGSYEDFCGTSAATPVVAGLAGLALSLRRDASAAQVEDALLRAGAQVPQVRYGRVTTAGMLAALGVAAPAPQPQAKAVVASWRGTTPGLGRAARLVRTVGSGSLTVSVAASRASHLTVAVVGAGGRTIARRSGASDVRIETPVTAGRVALEVAGATATPFRLTAVRSTPGAAG